MRQEHVVLQFLRRISKTNPFVYRTIKIKKKKVCFSFTIINVLIFLKILFTIIPEYFYFISHFVNVYQ